MHAGQPLPERQAVASHLRQQQMSLLVGLGLVLYENTNMVASLTIVASRVLENW